MSTRQSQYDGPAPGSREMTAAVQASIDRAKLLGTYTDITQKLCGGCRTLVQSIYFIVPLVRMPLCPVCADKFGQGPEADAKKFGRST